MQDTSKSPVLSVEQFDTIAQASHEFDLYLLTTHGLDEDKMAARDKIRAGSSYKRAENKKLKGLPLSDESESSSDSDVTKDASEDSSKSDSESERPSKHKKSKKKSKKTESKKQKKDKKESSRSERKKGKEKAKDTDKSDESSDSDD